MGAKAKRAAKRQSMLDLRARSVMMVQEKALGVP